MAIEVKFVSGQEKTYAAETAALVGPLFVLYRRTHGKLQSTETFPADQVILAQLSNGDIVLGRGVRKSN
jgi:hypothetical protein